MKQPGPVPETSPAAQVAVVIPVWQPDGRLTSLVLDLLGFGFGAVVIVNDGRDAAHEEVFADLSRRLTPGQRSRLHLVHHRVNLGKGRALKTGFEYFRRCFPKCAGVVTADADGQHRPADVLRVAEQLRKDPSRMVLGSRRLQRGTPFRSRFGNAVTRLLFALLTGRNLTDTQSGLRGIPAQLLPSMIALAGERYEYEMNVLTHSARSCGIFELPIEVVYLDGNRSSHFRPLPDSARICFVLLRSFASALRAAAADFLVFASRRPRRP